MKEWTSTRKGKAMQKVQRTFTREFKVEAVQLAKSSQKPLAQLAHDLGSADSTLHHWCKLFSEQGEQAFPGSGHQTPQEQEIRRLKRENEILRQERDILKCAVVVAVPLPRKSASLGLKGLKHQPYLNPKGSGEQSMAGKTR